MPVLACVLECSSISAMIFLAIFVVITRVGVNKDPPAEPVDPQQPAAEPVPDQTAESPPIQ